MQYSNKIWMNEHISVQWMDYWNNLWISSRRNESNNESLIILLKNRHVSEYTTKK